MRLVIDMQGAQSSGSRNRGIGRYVRALTTEIARQRANNEVIIVLNGAFPDTIDALRMEFSQLLPPEAICVWTPPRPCRALEEANDAQRIAAEAIYEAFLGSLNPDAVLITSLFEGFTDDAVSSIGRLKSYFPTAVILYDLIPLIHSEIYLTSAESSRWYHQKLDHLRRADLLLSISASSGREAIDYLAFPPERVVNISTACNDEFHPVAISPTRRNELASRYGLTKPFVMYTGGIDHRKNIEGLIRAFALLPKAVRNDHQLAVVCSAQDADRTRLENLARDVGLSASDLVMTGFVPEEDLLALYNTCKLFVFPSWHEGFGLPALEAMACGRPTICSNISSLPEVIGWDGAQFDPRDDKAIASLMAKGLTDATFRGELERNAVKQAKLFSWKKSASAAWQALLELATSPKQQATLAQAGRPRLAMVAPICSAKSGIADYTAELLPELARHYHIDIIAKQEETITDPWVLSNSDIRSVDWFRGNHRIYDRIVYQFGNSHFHSHMFDLLEEIPGVVVLHDFFLSSIAAHRDVTGEAQGSWPRSLLRDHGWPAVQARFTCSDSADVVWTYPCNGDVLRNATKVIVHSNHSLELAKTWHDESLPNDWSVIPHLRVPAKLGDAEAQSNLRNRVRRDLGIGVNQFVVCTFGHMGRTKLNHRLADAWVQSGLAEQSDCQLVFVGQNDGGEYGHAIAEKVTQHPKSMKITGFSSKEDYNKWLIAADAAVQLRTNSRGETSGAILDCWNYGLPTIVNAHGGFADLADDCTIKLSDVFTDEELSKSLLDLKNLPQLRQRIGESTRRHILEYNNPRKCSDLYRNAIEQAYARPFKASPQVISYISSKFSSPHTEELKNISNSMAQNFPPEPQKKRWLLDVSELVQRDSKSGIQRVVRALLQRLLLTPPAGIIIEPVYALVGQPGYRYARKFTCQFLGMPDDWCEDAQIEAWPGDTFLALDLQPVILREQIDQLTQLKTRGVKVLALVYDLLPLLLPHTFGESASNGHRLWLDAVKQLDGAVCISRAVADELRKWLDANGSRDRCLPFDIHYFHLGADIEESVPTLGIPADGKALLNSMSHTPSVLMVGTIEPRKGQELVLDAFEELWQAGSTAQLIIVGKQGWLVEGLVDRLRNHPEQSQRLHWLEAISDEYLENLYKAATCLIAASEGEGFGLPLIEAARHGVHLIARDIPVFREVAGKHAAYFPHAATPTELAEFISNWMVDWKSGRNPTSGGMQCLTWAESAEQLSDILLGKSAPYHQWQPNDALIYWGNDQRLGTQVGRRHGYSMTTTGKKGYLVYGPYASVKAGRYRIRFTGNARSLSGKEFVDAACGEGSIILAKQKVNSREGEWTCDLDIEVNHDISDLEARLEVEDLSDITLNEIRIEKVL